jgi:hypothetical protein
MVYPAKSSILQNFAQSRRLLRAAAPPREETFVAEQSSSTRNRRAVTAVNFNSGSKRQ